MRIKAIRPVVVEVNHRGDWIFVQVESDQGLIGLGEASHSSNDRLVLAALAEIDEMVRNTDPTRIEAARGRLMRRNAGRVWNTAVSAVEQALWDLLGQQLNAPIHALMGGPQRDRLRLYANINRHVRDRSPDGFARAAVAAAEAGYTAIKLAPFDELNEAVRVRTGPMALWHSGVERVRAVRNAVGPAVEVAVDCHSRMERSEALIVAEALAEFGIFWYEEPVRYTQPDDLAEITRQVPMPTASAESVFGLEDFRPFLTRRVVDILMPDVKHCGGILLLKEIASAARMQNLLIAPHQPAGPVATAATAHAVSTIDNFMILEHAWGEVDWRADLLDPPEQIVDGELLIPMGPGLGHRLNPGIAKDRTAAAKHRF